MKDIFKSKWMIAFIVFALVQLLVYLSLMVRRIHDTGNNAWKGFFAPMSYSALAYLLISIVIRYISTNSLYQW
jgi:uncharacterized membrane protein YhaH (DUF805 family)